MAEKYFGYAGKVIEVDLTNGTVEIKPLERELAENFIGGRGFTSRIQYKEVGTGIKPFDPDNVLIFATGPLTGTAAPAGNRFTVGGKSPLTGILGDSAAGGHWGPELKRAGYDMILFRGRSKNPVYLWVSGERVVVEDAKELWGKDTFETEDLLKEKLGKAIKVASIGKAGENLVRFACIISEYGRANGRVGMGALMGSKNLKAIAVKGEKRIQIYDRERMEKAAKEILELLHTDDYCTTVVPNVGTNRWLWGINEAGGLSTRNWQTGVFEGAEKIRGEKMVEKYIAERKTCFNCPLRCEQLVAVPSGRFSSIPTKIEYFSLASFGPKCGNDDLESIIKANELCARFGIDTTEMGSIIGFLMECYEKGLITPEECHGFQLRWGNAEAIVDLVKKTALRDGLGDVMAEGVKRASERIGKGTEKYAFHLKGASIESMDPRAYKTYNLRWRTSSRGADHLRGQGLAGLSQSSASDGKRTSVRKVLPIVEGVKILIWNEYACALADMLGVCKFPYGVYSSSWELQKEKVERLSDLLFAATGMKTSPEIMWSLTERLHNLERSFNSREGMRKRDDDMPWRFLEEPMPDGPCKGNVYTEADEYIEEYYRQRGWDVNTGVPKWDTLQKSGLSDVGEELRRLGIIEKD